MRIQIIILSMMFAMSGRAAADYGFEPFQTLSTDSQPTATVIGDVSGDQRDDLLVLTGCCGSNPDNDFKLLVFIQLPNGTLAAPLAYAYGSTINLFTLMKIADLDDDGDNDIVVSHFNGLSILRNDSNMTFSLRPVDAPGGLKTLDFTDVNDDGILDIVGQIGVPPDPTVRIYYGDGAGGISGSAGVDVIQSFEMQVADINNDQRSDLVVVGDKQVLIYLHNGASGFSTVPIVVSADLGWSIGRLVISDFNGDGRSDLAVGRRANSPTSVAIYYQRPGGSFRSRVSMDSYDIPDTMIAEDMNGDGLQDLVVAHSGWGATGLYLRRPGGFTHEAIFQGAGASRPTEMAVGDINGDGMKDIAVSVRQNGLQYMLGRASPVETDLGVSLGMTETVVAVRLDNYSHVAPTGPIYLQLDVSLRSGAFDTGLLPAGCERQPLGTGGFRVTCHLEGLTADDSKTLLLPLAIPPRAGRNRLTADAAASAGVRDVIPGNNQAWKQIDIPPPVSKSHVRENGRN